MNDSGSQEPGATTRTDLSPFAFAPLWLMRRLGTIHPGALGLYCWLQFTEATSNTALAGELGVSAGKIKDWRDELVSVGALNGRAPWHVTLIEPPFVPVAPKPRPPSSIDPPPTTEAEPAPRPWSDEAHALATLAYNQRPQPLTRGGFPAVASVLERALHSGQREGALRAMILAGSIEVWTVDGVAVALSKHPGAGENPDGWWLS